MRTILLFLTLFLSATMVHGQYTISGKVTDKEGKPLEFVTIDLNKDSMLITSMLTDSMGSYKIANLKAGDYAICFSFITSVDKSVLFRLTKDTLINKQIIAKGNSLKEVLVTAKKPLIERKVDRLVFYVENSITTIGSDAMEALSKTPGVKVLDNNISLIGKSGVGIMIDDRQIQLSGDDLANFLKSIAADDIASIEVITNPSAKYDAQGNSGLINIVLKKNVKRGYTGSVRGGYTQATYPTIFGGGNLNYNKGKFKFYANVNAVDGSTEPIYQHSIAHTAQTWDVIDSSRNYSKNLSGQIGVDYQASKNSLLGLSLNVSTSNPGSLEHISTPIYNIASGIDSTLMTNANSNNHTYFYSANIFLQQSLGADGKKITINGDLLDYDNNRKRYYDNTSYLGNGQMVPNSLSQYLSGGEQTNDIYTLKADVDLPYKKYTLGIGGKLSFINNRNEVSLSQFINSNYKIDTTQSDLFRYTENTQALYINVNKSIKKWAFQLGLRGEYTQTTGTSISFTNNVQLNPANNYFKVFPTLFVTYTKDDKNVFSVNYGKRINRPAYWSLNPFRWYSNPYTYTEGNPFLQPSYNNNIELAYTYNNIFTTSLSFNEEENRFRGITFVDNGSDTAVTKPLNFITGYTYLSNSSITINKIKWLESTETLCMYYNVSNSSLPQTQATVKGWGTWLGTDNQMTLNKSRTIVGGIDFYYVFPAVEDINKNGAYYTLDLSFKMLFLKKRLQLAVTANDLFKSSTAAVYTTINDIAEQQHDYYDSRKLRISLNYKFGNTKINRQQHESGNQEEKDRTN